MVGGWGRELMPTDDHRLTWLQAQRSFRKNPSLINGSRRQRIALGSGTNVPEVNKLMKQFEQMRKMMLGFTVR